MSTDAERIASGPANPDGRVLTSDVARETDDGVLVVARGGGVMFAGRLFTWAVRFGIAVVLARTLGADGYGLYNLAISVATVAASFPTLGLDAALVRFTAVASGRGAADQLHANLRFVIAISLALSLLAAGIIVVLSGTISEFAAHDARLAPLLLISAVVVPSMVLNRHLGAALQGVRRIEYAALAEQFAQPLVRVLLIAGLVVTGLSVANALGAWVAASLVATIILVLLLRRALPPRGGARTRAQTGELVRFSLPVFFSDIVSAVGHNLQTLMLGALGTVSAVGVFGVAAHLNMIGSLFHSSIVSASMALFAQAEARGDRRGLERLYQTVSKWSISLNLPLFLAILLFPDALLAMFGPEFAEGRTVLLILAGANLVNAATGTSGAVLDMTGHTRVKLVNATIGVGLALSLNLMLIPQLGILGAAIAVVASTSAVNVLRIAEVLLLLKTNPYNATFLKVVGAGAAAVLVVVAWKLLARDSGLLLEAALGIPLLVGTYAATLVRLGLAPEDRLVLDRVWHRLLRRKRQKGPPA